MPRHHLVLAMLAVLLSGGRPAQAAVCPITLSVRAGALGAAVELPEQIMALRCQAGDVLAITGDLHPASLARVCDLARAVVLHPVAPATGRPSGALCSYIGAIRPDREPPSEAAQAASSPAVPPARATPTPATPPRQP